jgi:hypothetical protein
MRIRAFMIRLVMLILLLYMTLQIDSCSKKSISRKKSEHHPSQLESESIQVLYFNPDSENEYLFRDLEIELLKRNIVVRPAVIDLGMVAFNIDKKDEGTLIELFQSNKKMYSRYLTLLDEDFSSRINNLTLPKK